MSRTMNPNDRLAEILRVRQLVRDQEEIVSSRREKESKAKASLKEAESELANRKRTLEDVIDDRPAGPLFDGLDENADRGAGDGPIRPPGAVDAAVASANAEEPAPRKKRGSKKKP